MKYSKVLLGRFFPLVILLCVFNCCSQTEQPDCGTIKPIVVTDTVKWDTDDPAIWINPDDPTKSLIIGTDKESDGALYVFDLNGKIIEEKVVRNLKRPNNVDVEYGLILNGKSVDIAVATEREANKIRIYSLPEMKAVDNGGIEVFEGEEQRAPMGISLYKRPTDGAVFAIISRKEGPLEGYLWQYLLSDDGTGNVKGTKVRAFGLYSGVKEIESIAVDDQLGYVYYSDEQYGIRKYYVDPDVKDANKELGIIYVMDYLEDSEGISIYPVDDKTGYILVSDQSANRFRIYTREGTLADPEEETPAQPHNHKLVKIVNASTNNSDGSEVTNMVLNEKFPGGFFVAMSDNKTFQYYSWKDIAGDDLIISPNGVKQEK
ncbi:MAG: 3-phytase [Ignavibacteria bacterium RBG_13_36_8]|nr:MAG: 3-phytase [Ignavibacteria bacterium RBG_13_36_8]